MNWNSPRKAYCLILLSNLMVLSPLQTRLIFFQITAVYLFVQIGRQLLIYGRRIHYPEIEALVNSVTKEDITRCLTELINSNKKALCLIGDLTNVPSIFPDVPQITNPEKIHEDYYCKYIEKLK